MALAVGTKAPDFNVKDTNGNPVTLSGLAGKKVVMYFYPKDDTPGCTKQACSFRDNYAVYQEKGIVILGVSKDDESSHQAFTAKFDLPFPLLADINGEIVTAYDVDGGGYAKRVTYAIDENGNIVHVDASVNTATHATDILTALGF
jgi:thioredoxin-dependent peroxiredoxin